MIAIVDLRMGNLRSVQNALHSLGFDVVIAQTAKQLTDVTHVVLPGVGSFATAMEHMVGQDLHGAILERVRSGTPMLGICLGMQLLASVGDEGGPRPGLGIIPGRVVRFEPSVVPTIPHVGWNELRLRREHPVFAKVKSGVDFYYVHSYCFVCDDERDQLGVSEYGGTDFTSAVAHGNVVGLQFHPEKSQTNGLRILENFCTWDGRC